MGEIIKGSISFETESCIECGMSFAMLLDFINQRRDDHKSFYCPSGHEQHYVDETEEENLKKQLVDLVQKRSRSTTALKAEKRSNAALRGEITKLKKRLHILV